MFVKMQLLLDLIERAMTFNTNANYSITITIAQSQWSDSEGDSCFYLQTNGAKAFGCRW